MTIIKTDFLVTTRISVGDFFGVPDADAYIELREPDTRAWFKLESVFRTGDNEKIIEHFIGILPGLIVGHSIMKSQDTPMTALEVTELVASKLALFMFILGEYKEKVLFTLGKKSDGK